MFAEHDDMSIDDEPNDSSSSAIPADAVNGLDKSTQRQCLLLVIGSHATTIGWEGLPVLWGIHLWGVDPTGD